MNHLVYAITILFRPLVTGGTHKEKALPSASERRAFVIDRQVAAKGRPDQKATVAETTTREPAIDEPSLVDEKFGVR